MLKFITGKAVACAKWAKGNVAAIVGGGLALIGAGSASAQVADGTINIPAVMDPEILVEAALAALGPIFIPAVTLVAVVGLALGIIGFVWRTAKRGGRGG